MSSVEITDVLVLAAVDRAERHRARDRPEVPTWAVAEHVGVRPRSIAHVFMRYKLEELTEAGLLERSRVHGSTAWVLTPVGRRRLRRARSLGRVPALGEAPQHAVWRRAHARAEARIGGFGVAVADALRDASLLLGRMREGSAVASDDWFAVAERLREACRTLGSACYCLYEWREPEDDRPDIDTHVEPGDARLGEQERKRRRARRAGRRNTRLWETPASPAGGEQ